MKASFSFIRQRVKILVTKWEITAERKNKETEEATVNTQEAWNSGFSEAY